MMRVLHYTLGFSPYRSGGLTKYAADLMLSQKGLGHDVMALYPGGLSLLKPRCHVHQSKAFHGINVYEMTNPLSVPLLYGVKDTEESMTSKQLDMKSFENMLDLVRPEVFHIHTLMGLPLEYIKKVHERGIRIVYTSHDYFGLCPKVNFINQDGEVCVGASGERCAACNANAKSALFLRLRNAKWMVPLKGIVRRLIR